MVLATLFWKRCKLYRSSNIVFGNVVKTGGYSIILFGNEGEPMVLVTLFWKRCKLYRSNNIVFENVVKSVVLATLCSEMKQIQWF